MLRKPITILGTCTTLLSFSSIVEAEELHKQSTIQMEEVTRSTTPSYYVQASVLNVRKNPTTSSTIIGKLSNGKKLDVLSLQNGWYKIEWKNGSGYVHADYVTKKETTNRPSSSSSTYEVTANALNVRSKASTSGSIVGSAKKGQKLQGNLLHNGWLKITWNGKTAYVSGTYIKKIEQSSSTNTPDTTTKTNYRVTAHSLNIRSGPSTTNKIIGSAKKDTYLKVENELSNGWLKITWNGKTAYVSGTYVKKSSNSNSNSKPDINDNKELYKVTANYLNVRSSSSANSNILTSVKKGTVLNVTKELSNGWLQIKWGGKVGYVNGHYVSKPTTSVPPVVEKATHLVTVHSLNVRTGPDTTYSVIGKLKQGDTVTAIQVHGDWIEFMYNGRKAFVAKNYTKPMNGNPFPPSPPESSLLPNAKKVIVLDAGHGGHDPGAVSDTGVLEKDVTLSVVKKAKVELEKKGYVVILTRDTDRYLSLKERTDIASDVRANVFLSIHSNAAANKNATGIESWYYSYNPSPSNSDHENKSLAQHIQVALIKELHLLNRGIKNGDFYVIRNTPMPSALLELGFLSNDRESILLSQSATHNRMAKAIAHGVETFFQN